MIWWQSLDVDQLLWISPNDANSRIFNYKLHNNYASLLVAGGGIHCSRELLTEFWDSRVVFEQYQKFRLGMRVRLDNKKRIKRSMIKNKLIPRILYRSTHKSTSRHKIQALFMRQNREDNHLITIQIWVAGGGVMRARLLENHI